MKKRKTLCCVVLFFLFLIISGCNFMAEVFHGPEPEENLVIYVVGYEVNDESKRVAMIWKNGVGTALTDGTKNAYANAIVVSGTDVYVAGQEDGLPTLWKNGAASRLYNNSSYDSAEAQAIAVSGQDVYVAGNTREQQNIPGIGWGNVVMLWKNGVSSQIITNESLRGGLAVIGSDVFCSTKARWGANLWKNGVVVSYNYGETPEAMTVSGSDVYRVLWDSYYSPPAAGFRVNNGPFNMLYRLSGGSIIDAAVVNNDVYTVGSEGNSGVIVRRNGAAVTALSGGGLPLAAKAIAVVGSDIYAAGNIRNSGGTTVAMIWKNGTGTALTSSFNNADAAGMAVGWE